jgi:hypothetical protein
MAESQHYLPQFYLKEFTDPETPEGQEPYLWIYEYEFKKWKKRAPKNVASKPDFYTLIEKGGKRRDEIEEALAIVEGKTASIYREKIRKRGSLTEEEKGFIASFVAFMITRVPSFHKTINSWVADVVKTMMSMYQDRPQAFERLKKQFEKEKGEKLPADLDAKSLDPSRYKIKTSKGLILRTMIGPLLDVSIILYNMSWTFLHTSDEAAFITSDCPFSMWNPKAQAPWFGHGLAHKDIEVSLPFSKKICLLASWKERTRQHLDVPPHAVELVNQFRVSFSDKFIISSRKDFPGSEYLKRKMKRKIKE